MPIAILVHGGSGPASPDELAEACGNACLAAARAGYAVLEAGGSAVDAVEAAAAALEDDPIFNAGTGSTLNVDGDVEMDASLMSGERLQAGAVAGVRRLRNPVKIARLVMERTSHVLLVSEGAEAFAQEQGVAFIDPASLITPRQRQKWEKARAQPPAPNKSGGTIGAVAVDRHGHVAAATSTGGMLMKRRGRVGDSPLIGAGTYADDRGAAVSCTGQGEAIIKVVLAKRASDLITQGREPMAAAAEAIAALDRVGGDGGLILADPRGRLGFAFNSDRMSRGWIDSDGREGWGFARGT